MSATNTNTEIALLKQETQYIKEGVARLEKKQDEQHNLLYAMLKEMRDSLPEKFVTRPEHDQNKIRIDEHDKIIARIAWGSFFSLLGIIATFIGIEKFL